MKTQPTANTRRICVPVANITQSAQASALDRQALLGTPIEIDQSANGRILGRNMLNDHSGYFAAKDLAPWRAPSHVVRVRASFAFQSPNLKTPKPIALSYGAQVKIIAQEGLFLQTDDGYFIPKMHLPEVNQICSDPAAEALKLLHTPYLWGGNSAFGIDCSGLIQLALNAAGQFCPADSHPQQIYFDGPRPPHYARNQLLFWRGHVALTLDDQRLIHANAHSMNVAIEGITQAIERIAAAGGGDVLHHVFP